MWTDCFCNFMHLKYINKQFKGSLFNKMYAERKKRETSETAFIELKLAERVKTAENNINVTSNNTISK